MQDPCLSATKAAMSAEKLAELLISPIVKSRSVLPVIVSDRNLVTVIKPRMSIELEGIIIMLHSRDRVAISQIAARCRSKLATYAESIGLAILEQSKVSMLVPLVSSRELAIHVQSLFKQSMRCHEARL